MPCLISCWGLTNRARTVAAVSTSGLAVTDMPMDERIRKIQELLGDVSRDLNPEEGRPFAHNFDALEIPSVVSSVIQLLQPLLTPYEAAVYWHMFDRSVLQTGQQFCRVSTRGLMTGVIRSASGQSEGLSIQTTRGALQGLEENGRSSSRGNRTVKALYIEFIFPRKFPCALPLSEQSPRSPPLQHLTSRMRRTFTTWPRIAFASLSATATSVATTESNLPALPRRSTTCSPFSREETTPSAISRWLVSSAILVAVPGPSWTRHPKAERNDGFSVERTVNDAVPALRPLRAAGQLERSASW